MVSLFPCLELESLEKEELVRFFLYEVKKSKGKNHIALISAIDRHIEYRGL